MLYVAKKCCAIVPRFVYSITGTPGFMFESWTGADASGVGNPDFDQAGFEAAWSGPVVDGIPTHPNGAPTISGVEADERFAQQEPGQDEHRLTYWILNEDPVPIQIRDDDTRAESVQVYASCDCPASLVHEKYQDSGAPHNSQGPFITIPPSALVKLTVLIHDPGPDFSGFWPRANKVGDTDLFIPRVYQSRPVVDCRKISWQACDPYVLAPGESYKLQELNCLDCGGGEGLDEDAVQALIDASATPHVQPATVLPIPDNEIDTAIRTGQVGTSLDYALADHNHPIRRQVHPAWPGVTTTNIAALNGEIVLDRRSTEEWIEFEIRLDMQILAGNNWPIVRIPTIAGFQQPIITVTNTYRNASSTYQEDDQPTNSAIFDGAAPVGPYMGIEASHWSSTRGVYFPFRRETDQRWFLGASVKYVRS